MQIRSIKRDTWPDIISLRYLFQNRVAQNPQQEHAESIDRSYAFMILQNLVLEIPPPGVLQKDTKALELPCRLGDG